MSVQQKTQRELIKRTVITRANTLKDQWGYCIENLQVLVKMVIVISSVHPAKYVLKFGEGLNVTEEMFCTQNALRERASKYIHKFEALPTRITM